MKREEFYQQVFLTELSKEGAETAIITSQLVLSEYDEHFGKINTQEMLDEIADRMPQFKTIRVETPFGRYPMLVDSDIKNDLAKYLCDKPKLNVEGVEPCK